MAYDFKNDPSNPNAVPLYNDNILKFWNWFDTVWNCNDWMTWHKSMTKYFGVSKANSVFMGHWENLATGSSAIDCRTFNTSFRDYMRKVGLLDSLYSGLGVVAKPLGAGSDVLTGVVKGVSGVGKGVGNAGKVASVLLPLLLIIAVVFLSLYLYKKSKAK